MAFFAISVFRAGVAISIPTGSTLRTSFISLWYNGGQGGSVPTPDGARKGIAIAFSRKGLLWRHVSFVTHSLTVPYAFRTAGTLLGSVATGHTYEGTGPVLLMAAGRTPTVSGGYSTMAGPPCANGRGHIGQTPSGMPFPWWESGGPRHGGQGLSLTIKSSVGFIITCGRPFFAIRRDGFQAVQAFLGGSLLRKGYIISAPPAFRTTYGLATVACRGTILRLGGGLSLRTCRISTLSAAFAFT